MAKDIIKDNFCDDDHSKGSMNAFPCIGPESPVPLLNFMTGFETAVPSKKGKKLSLSLTKISQKQIQQLSPAKKTRKIFQRKKSYQRVPHEDPSLLSPVSPVFTLQQPGKFSTDFFFNQNMCRSKAGSYEDSKDSCSEKYAQTSLLEIPTSEKGVYGNQGQLSRQDKPPSRSLGDITVVNHERISGKLKNISSNRSASVDDLSLLRQKMLSVAGSSDSKYAHGYLGDRYISSTFSSRYCLSSAHRASVAASSTHLRDDSDQTVRLAFLGGPGVGKTSIVSQFVLQNFEEEYIPTEETQFFCPIVIINGHLYEVIIVDYPDIQGLSPDEWMEFRRYGLRNTTVYVLVFDVMSEESFEYIKILRRFILESQNKRDTPIFVVGNKRDLTQERGVPMRELREIANLVRKRWKCGYIECSAKYNWHIMLLFKELMKTVDYLDYGHRPTSMKVQDALSWNRCLIL